MLTSAQIKTIRSLKDKKFRDESGMFVVEGDKLVKEAVESSFKVIEVYRTSEIGEAAMKRISLLNTPSTALALVEIPSKNTGMHLSDGGLYLALDSIRDPGNMGTILRIADWYGLDGVFASEDSVDIFNPKVVQSTMGAIFRVPFSYCDLVELCSEADAEVYGTFLKGENIYESDLRHKGPGIIVTGNEANGISEAVARKCTRRITIPSFAKGRGSESLNAAVATAITVSEFRRR